MRTRPKPDKPAEKITKLGQEIAVLRASLENLAADRAKVPPKKSPKKP